MGGALSKLGESPPPQKKNYNSLDISSNCREVGYSPAIPFQEKKNVDKNFCGRWVDREVHNYIKV